MAPTNNAHEPLPRSGGTHGPFTPQLTNWALQQVPRRAQCRDRRAGGTSWPLLGTALPSPSPCGVQGAGGREALGSPAMETHCWVRALWGDREQENKHWLLERGKVERNGQALGWEEEERFERRGKRQEQSRGTGWSVCNSDGCDTQLWVFSRRLPVAPGIKKTWWIIIREILNSVFLKACGSWKLYFASSQAVRADTLGLTCRELPSSVCKGKKDVKICIYALCFPPPPTHRLLSIGDFISFASGIISLVFKVIRQTWTRKKEIQLLTQTLKR